MSNDRHSYTEQREIVADPIEKARLEVENGIRQYELMADLIRRNVRTGNRFRLRTKHIMQLQDAALSGLDPLAGTFRNTPIEIRGSRHSPPDQFSVPDEVGSLCEYVNENWGQSAIHLAAYILWRLNWIHPFSDGNGRTARAISYAVLCIRLDGLLPGAPTIPEQIAANKSPYYDALEKADRAFDEKQIDVTALEHLLSEMLANQLLSIAALSEQTEDRLKSIVASRVNRANAEVLERIYSTRNPVGHTWQIGLDQFAFQIASPEEIGAAQERNREFGSPFPHLLAANEERDVQRKFSEVDNGTIINSAKFELVGNEAMFIASDVAIGVGGVEVSASDVSWNVHGGLYLARLGKDVSAENVYEIVDLLISKHIATG